MEIHYQVEMLGGLTVRADDGRTLTRFRSRQTTSLLAFLAFHRNKRHAREVLIEMFWPDAPSYEKARLSFYVALSSLRSQLEPAPLPQGTVLITEGATLRLNPRLVTTDVERFEALVTEREWQQAVEAYTGPLLPGFYDDWVLREQERLGDRYHQAVRQVVKECESAGQSEEALHWWRLAVTNDPGDMDMVSGLLQALVQVGRHEEAAQTFYTAEKRLRETESRPVPAAVRQMVEDFIALYPSPFTRRKGRPRKQAETNPAEEGVGTDRGADVSAVPAASPPVSSDLPLQLNQLIGRDAILEQLRKSVMSRTTRLLTLTGLSGIGKTHLAIELTNRLRHHGYATHFLSLLSLQDSKSFIPALAQMLGIPSAGGISPLLARIAEALNAQPTILLLDNFEHLVETEMPYLVGQLLARAPTLTCLVTSQKRLPIPGEIAFPIPPLPVPSKAELLPGAPSQSPEEFLNRYPSVELFVERARNALPDFQLIPGNLSAVGELARVLDGVPLAIELAAARINILSPAEIKIGLTEHLGILSSTRIEAKDRHRSLEASLQWSYGLLPPAAQQLFRRISVFRGGFAAADIAAVVHEEKPFDSLARLADASLVYSNFSDTGVRLSMLGIVQQFASELMDAEEGERTRQRHADCYIGMAQEARKHWRGKQESAWLDWLAMETENIDAAGQWLLTRTTPEALFQAYTLAQCISNYWQKRGKFEDGRSFLSRLLQKPAEDIPWDLRTPVINALAILEMLQGEWSQADIHLAAAAEVVRAQQQRVLAGGVPQDQEQQGKAEHLLAGLLNNRAIVAQQRGDYGDAREFLLACRDIYEQLGDLVQVGLVLGNLGSLAMDEGALTLAEQYCQESRQVADSCGDRSTVAIAWANLGEIYLRTGHIAKATEAEFAALETFAELKETVTASAALLKLSVLLKQLGHERAAESARDAGWNYRVSLSLPTEEFQKGPYFLKPMQVPNPLPPHQAESRLLAVISTLIGERAAYRFDNAT